MYLHHSLTDAKCIFQREHVSTLYKSFGKILQSQYEQQQRNRLNNNNNNNNSSSSSSSHNNDASRPHVHNNNHQPFDLKKLGFKPVAAKANYTLPTYDLNLTYGTINDQLTLCLNDCVVSPRIQYVKNQDDERINELDHWSANTVKLVELYHYTQLKLWFGSAARPIILINRAKWLQLRDSNDPISKYIGFSAGLSDPKSIMWACTRCEMCCKDTQQQVWQNMINMRNDPLIWCMCSIMHALASEKKVGLDLLFSFSWQDAFKNIVKMIRKGSHLANKSRNEEFKVQIGCSCPVRTITLKSFTKGQLKCGIPGHKKTRHLRVKHVEELRCPGCNRLLNEDSNTRIHKALFGGYCDQCVGEATFLSSNWRTLRVTSMCELKFTLGILCAKIAYSLQVTPMFEPSFHCALVLFLVSHEFEYEHNKMCALKACSRVCDNVAPTELMVVPPQFQHITSYYAHATQFFNDMVRNWHDWKVKRFDSMLLNSVQNLWTQATQKFGRNNIPCPHVDGCTYRSKIFRDAETMEQIIQTFRVETGMNRLNPTLKQNVEKRNTITEVDSPIHWNRDSLEIITLTTDPFYCMTDQKQNEWRQEYLGHSDASINQKIIEEYKLENKFALPDDLKCHVCQVNTIKKMIPKVQADVMKSVFAGLMCKSLLLRVNGKLFIESSPNYKFNWEMCLSCDQINDYTKIVYVGERHESYRNFWHQMGLDDCKFVKTLEHWQRQDSRVFVNMSVEELEDVRLKTSLHLDPNTNEVINTNIYYKDYLRQYKRIHFHKELKSCLNQDVVNNELKTNESQYISNMPTITITHGCNKARNRLDQRRLLYRQQMSKYAPSG